MNDPEPRRDKALRLGLAALLGTTTYMHIKHWNWFSRMVPDWVPGDPDAWNAAATTAEGTAAALMLSRKTAGMGGVLAAGTLLAVFPANVQQALDGGIPLKGPLGSPAVAWARLPIQIPLIQWGLKVSRNARKDAA